MGPVQVKPTRRYTDTFRGCWRPFIAAYAPDPNRGHVQTPDGYIAYWNGMEHSWSPMTAPPHPHPWQSFRVPYADPRHAGDAGRMGDFVAYDTEEEAAAFCWAWVARKGQPFAVDLWSLPPASEVELPEGAWLDANADDWEGDGA